MLTINRLTKSFYRGGASEKVINNISLQVKPGQVFGFLGLNGAGKTTTVKLVAGLLKPDKGTIKIGALNHSDLAARQLIGFMPETPQFYAHLKAREVLEYVGALFELDKATIAERVPRLLKTVGLADAAKQPVRQFSKGMSQRLGFAAALMNDPALLILDEPLDGLDPLGRLAFKQLIAALKKQKKTVFFSSHILSDVAEICDDVAILHRGKIIAQGSPKQLIGRSRKSLEEIFVEKVRTNA